MGDAFADKAMNELLGEIRQCQICVNHLEHGVNPVMNAHAKSKIAIIGQAPGKKVHESGVPWRDASGKNLRSWLDVSEETFYEPKNFAIIPMGFCYPGKGTSGDLPPRPECAPTWHPRLLTALSQVKLTLLLGQYAQDYYLGSRKKKNLTETVKAYSEYLPDQLVLPHPSPRNRFWQAKNPWFQNTVIPLLQKRVQNILTAQT